MGDGGWGMGMGQGGPPSFLEIRLAYIQRREYCERYQPREEQRVQFPEQTCIRARLPGCGLPETRLPDCGIPETVTGNGT